MAKQSNFKYGIQLDKNVLEPLHLGNQYFHEHHKKINQIIKTIWLNMKYCAMITLILL